MTRAPQETPFDRAGIFVDIRQPTIPQEPTKAVMVFISMVFFAKGRDSTVRYCAANAEVTTLQAYSSK
jgi:hypothetical protein